MLRSTLALAALLSVSVPVHAQPLSLTPLGTFNPGTFRDEDPRVAEINAYDPEGRRIYVVNPLAGLIDVIDIETPAAPVPAAPVDLLGACQQAVGAGCPLTGGLEPNSVAIHGRLLGVAVAHATRTANGHAVFFMLRGKDTPQFLAAVEVGALPDMITFTEDGHYALTADEGEPDATYTIDPPGSISIIDTRALGAGTVARRAGFEAFDTPEQRAKLERDGVPIFGPNARPSQDLEPEYVTTSKHLAYVSLQENNALAIVNVPAGKVLRVVGLGVKDYSDGSTAIDASDRDGINIRQWPIVGMYQPDALQAFRRGGRTYLIAANEGDARDYDGFSEESRLSGVSLDPLAYPDAALLKSNAVLGRLTVTTATGDTDGDGDIDVIHAFGGRSVSIRDQQGRLVWDSGNLFDRLSRDLDAAGVTLFHTSNNSNARDNRSDDKGVEPESVVVGEIDGRLYAFVGLERDSGLVALDISDPAAPALVTYATNRTFPTDATGAFLPCSAPAGDCGDLGPEGLTFVPAADSPTGRPLLIVSNEVSSTTTIWEIR